MSNSEATPRALKTPLARPPMHLTQAESCQIDLSRILCIFFMIGVHVYPGLQEESYLYQGPAHWFWVFYVDMLGRASVPILSFFSGYMLLAYQADTPIPKYAKKRATTIYLPMVTWSVIKVLLVFALVIGLEGQSVAAALERLGAVDVLSTVNLVFALTDHPADITLSFLRDLFICLMLTRLCVPIIRRAPVMLLSVVFVIAVLDLAEPVILRPTILLFGMIGAAFAVNGFRLTEISRPIWTVPVIIAFALGWWASVYLPESYFWASDFTNIMKRLTMATVFLCISGLAIKHFDLSFVTKYRALVFVTYLAHAIVGQILAKIWGLTGISNMSPYYMVFYFSCIAIYVMSGFVILRIINMLPVPLQFALRGAANRN